MSRKEPLQGVLFLRLFLAPLWAFFRAFCTSVDTFPLGRVPSLFGVFPCVLWGIACGRYLQTCRGSAVYAPKGDRFGGSAVGLGVVDFAENIRSIASVIFAVRGMFRGIRRIEHQFCTKWNISSIHFTLRKIGRSRSLYSDFRNLPP